MRSVTPTCRATAPLTAIFTALFAAALDSAYAVEPFTNEAVARGLAYVMQPYPQSEGYLGFGCAFADLDNDGDPDVVILGAADGHVGVFENDGTGNFTDRSSGNGIPLLTEASGIAIADYDDDGRPDIYITQLGEPNLLLHNDGNWQFSDVAAALGVDDDGAGKGASFGDYNGDGRLDLYLCNYNGIAPDTRNIDNKLYRNDYPNGFTDVGPVHGVDNEGRGFQSLWFDYDLDGDADLYLSNDRALLFPFISNQLWRNDGGMLVNVSEASGADIAIDSMGIASGDFDGNGYLDLYCTNVPGVGGMFNPLLLNQGDGTFVESSGTAGVQNPVSGTSWGTFFFDVNNDTWLDLYVNNQDSPNTLYVHDGSFPTMEMALLYNAQGNSGRSFASAFADVDGDNDLDILLNNLNNNVQLLINHEGELRNAIRYRIEGLAPNRHAVGARTETRVGSTWLLSHLVAGGNNYTGQNELVIHVGLNTATTADEVVVTWPGGTPTRTLTNLPANATWTLYPPDRIGDADGDGHVTPLDFANLADCYLQTFTPGCEISDFDGDSDVDENDYDAFLLAAGLQPGDCNNNGIPDLEDIIADPSLDLDEDGTIDTCIAIPTMSAWGVAVMTLALMAAATAILRTRQDTEARHA